MAEPLPQLSPDDLRRLIRDTVRETIEDYLEDLAALASPDYLASIREARDDARAGRTVALDELAVDDASGG
jgi:hypothetical protein